jgi:hypothetical protein
LLDGREFSDRNRPWVKRSSQKTPSQGTPGQKTVEDNAAKSNSYATRL